MVLEKKMYLLGLIMPKCQLIFHQVYLQCNECISLDKGLGLWHWLSFTWLESPLPRNMCAKFSWILEQWFWRRFSKIKMWKVVKKSLRCIKARIGFQQRTNTDTDTDVKCVQTGRRQAENKTKRITWAFSSGE